MNRSYKKLDYAYKRMFIVEVPAQFKSFKSLVGSVRNIFSLSKYSSKKGYLLARADLEGAKKELHDGGAEETAIWLKRH